jgi:DNA-binding MarR family transcriptional regulator
MSELGIRVLTAAYQILLYLHENGEATSGEILAHCQLTPATFQKYLADLVARNLVRWEKDKNDGRRHRYHLDKKTRDILNEELRFPLRWEIQSTDPERALETFITRMRKRLNIRIFSNESQILLMLYDRGKLTTGQLRSYLSASPGVFYVTMRRLVDLKHIRDLPAPGDGRQKLHELTARSSALLEQVHLELRQWAARLPI